MNFNLSVQKWHLVSEKGLPKDGTWCFLVWKSAKDEYEWTVGGYNEAEKYFYANLGLGGIQMKLLPGQNFSRTKPLRQSR